MPRKADKTSSAARGTSKSRDKATWRKGKFNKDKEVDYNCPDQRYFETRLQSMGLIIKHVDGDGNCMFRSLADQLCGDQERHAEYRDRVCAYLEANEEYFALFTEDDEPVEEYILRMREDGEWGGHQELYAASRCFATDILVYQSDPSAPQLLLETENRAKYMLIRLSYHGSCHYNSVMSVDGEVETRPVDDHEAEAAVRRAVPWASVDRIRLALRAARGLALDAIELLIELPQTLNQLEIECDGGEESATGLPQQGGVAVVTEGKGSEVAVGGSELHRVKISKLPPPQRTGRALSKKERRRQGNQGTEGGVEAARDTTRSHACVIVI
jgi:hypothetical protein